MGGFFSGGVGLATVQGLLIKVRHAKLHAYLDEVSGLKHA